MEGSLDVTTNDIDEQRKDWPEEPLAPRLCAIYRDDHLGLILREETNPAAYDHIGASPGPTVQLVLRRERLACRWMTNYVVPVSSMGEKLDHRPRQVIHPLECRQVF
jgi:hypothetical protein